MLASFYTNLHKNGIKPFYEPRNAASGCMPLKQVVNPFLAIQDGVPYRWRHKMVVHHFIKKSYYAQNSGNSSSLPIFSIRSSSTNTTVGRTMRLPFLMARPAPI